MPSGFRIVTSVPPPGDEPIETLDRSRLTVWFSVPVNEYWMFWPGTVLVTTVAAPVVRIVPVASAGTV